MANLIFQCPLTGMNVQHWLDESEASDRDGLYEAVTCKACSRLHFIHRSSGTLLGQPDE
jgi:hypothetical protein